MRHRLTSRIVTSHRSLFTSASTYGLLAVCLAGLSPVAAQAQSVLPTGGTVTSGSASIATGTGSVTVTQTSDRAIVNWTGFDVGAGKSVVFAQPNANSATLNRVIGGTTSTIAGSITSNGAVYLVNPNGIAITATGSVQTGGGFVASTLDIADGDFNAGKLNFTGTGASKSVSNAGTINAGAGAYVALLGGSVSNVGTITVPLGKVALGSGESIALDLNGDGFMQVAVPTTAITGGNTALVEMAGSIAASGGRVELKAASVKDAVRNVVNLTGSISADSASGSGGTIILLGGDGGTVHATGTLSAKATGATGDGGFVETSGAAVDFTGLKVDTTARGGKTGTWLVDPTDLTVDAAAAATISTNLATANVTLQTTSTTASGPGVQAPGNGDITIASAINWTSANTLSLLAYNNIALNAGVTGTAGGLTLTAGNGTAYTGAITATGAVNVGIFNLTNGNWSQVAATLPSFNARDFRFAVANATFLRATGGTGASGNPYTIADVYGLQGIASSNQLSQSFALANNIDASGTANWNSGAGFIPIGTDGSGNVANITNSGMGFTGAFNGQGYVVNGLTINRGAASDVGLFGVATGSTISNIGLTGVNITGGVSNSGMNTGGLVGYFDNGLITNANVSGTVTGLSTVGGLVGYSGSTGSISYSYSSAGVNASGTAVGGLVGDFRGTMGNSYASGSVTASSTTSAALVGGLVGFASGTISNVYATGAVTSAGGSVGGLIGRQGAGGVLTSAYASGKVVGSGTSVGGLIGRQNAAAGATAGGSATNAYWDTYSTGQSSAIGVASGTSTNLTAVTSDPNSSGAANYAFKATAYANLTAATGLGTATPTGFVFFSGGSTRPFLAFEVPVAGNPGIFTNASNQILLTNSHQLQLIGYNGTTLAASYALANAIDLTETGRATVGTPASYSGMWAGTGWLPIGTDGAGLVWDAGQAAFIAGGATGFSGSLNGNNFVINRLNINRTASGNPGSRIGLFGLTSTGTISNLGLTNGTVTGRTFVGGLVGVQNTGTLSNVYSAVNVMGTTTNDGGLVGSQNAGGVVTNAYATGTVTGTGSVGGLIGIARGTISNVYATGTITATSGASAFGGLIGFMNGGTLTSAYATGNVVGGNAGSIGGLIGSASSATVQYVYATGAVSGYDNIGGLIGFHSFGTLDNAYSSGAVSSATAQSIGGLIGNAQGTIANAYWDTFSSGQGTGGGAAVAVTSDPNQSGAPNYAFKASAYANLAGASGIGTATPTGFVFVAGNTTRPFLAFEAPTSASVVVDTSGRLVLTNSHQLQLINTNAATQSGSYVLGGNISLAETGANTGTAATSAGMWSRAGFVPLGTDGAGNVWNGTGYVLLGTITGGVAGFTGSLNGNGYTLSGLTINRTTAKHTGLFGVSSGALSNLTLTGTVAGFNNAGGAVGLLYRGGSVTGVTSAVVVSGNNSVGGLVGNAFDTSSVATSSASGAVSGAADIGGLVGYASAATIARSFATGAVTGAYYSGGLVGYLYNSAVSNSYSTGTVNGTSTTGGLVGVLDGGSVTNSYAAGAVSGSTLLGGLVGQVRATPTVTSSYWDTVASGRATSAAGTGRTTAQMQDTVNYATNFAGWDFVTIWSPPTTGNYPKLRK